MFLLLIFSTSLYTNSPMISDVKVGGIYFNLSSCQSQRNNYSSGQSVCVKVES